VRIYFKTIIFGKDFIIDATTTLNIQLRQNTHTSSTYIQPWHLTGCILFWLAIMLVSSSSGGANLKILGKGCRWL